MPIYEYHCKKCGADFEELRSRADMDKRRACPTCRSRATQRKVSMQFAVVAYPDQGALGDEFDFGGGLEDAHGTGDDEDDFDLGDF